jgi:nitroreductase
MDVFEAMSTTRAMRRLDTTKPVSDEDIHTMLEAATMAASGGNMQIVRWMVVRDAAQRAALGEVYGRCWRMVRPMYASREDDPRVARLLRSADHLGDHMGEAPVILLPCSKGEPGQAESSVFPGVQNLFLAGRALGLGTTLTTVHRFEEDTVREILGIPADVNTWCMIPVGHPLGRWAQPRRKPVTDIAYLDTWSTPLPGA